MTISIDERKPIDTHPYLEVGRGQSKHGEPIILHQELPIYLGTFEHEKTGLDFLIICSDLQGVVEEAGAYQLLGEALPEFLKLLIEIELSEGEKPRIGVLLCGDLFTSLDKRGSSGDVRVVWQAFKAQFDWVIGVAGNQDRFGTELEKAAFASNEGISLLHKDIQETDRLRIGGISGIIGRGDKVNRVDEAEYLDTLRYLLKQDLDLILLHETPDHPELGFIGNERIRAVLEKGRKANICCGHCHWDRSLVELDNGSCVINVDSKVVILKKV
ncbi:MAG: metallophosphoesterase [Bacteroidota bacterium]